MILSKFIVRGMVVLASNRADAERVGLDCGETDRYSAELGPATVRSGRDMVGTTSNVRASFSRAK